MQIEERKKNALVELAKRFRYAVVVVYSNMQIPAKVATWYVGPRHLVIGVKLKNPAQTADALSERVLMAIGHSSKLGSAITATQSGGLIQYEFRLPQRFKWGLREVDLWRTITTLDDGFSNTNGVGLTLDNKVVEFSIEDGAPHTVVSGKSGSGKTTLLSTIVYRLAQHNDTQKLTLILCDVKGDFRRFRDLAHLRYQPASEYMDIERSIAWVYSEFLARLKSQDLPENRLVLVLDEADHHSIIGNPNIEKQLLDISLRGRAVKVNLIVGTHVSSKSSLGDLNAELSYRFLGATANAKESGQTEGGLQLHKLSGQGDFFLVKNGDKLRFQAAVTPDSAIDALPHAKIEEVPGIFPTLEVNSAPIKPAHRPKIQATPEKVAYYIHMGPENVSQTHAKEALGLSRTQHERNRDFAREIAACLEQLQQQ